MAKPYETFLYMLKNTAPLQALMSKRAYHALKPKTATLPNITFFESGGRRFSGIENQSYTVNCRAKTVEEAIDLAREVYDLFGGTSSTGIYARQNGFDIARSFSDTESNVIPEGNSVYNAVIFVNWVYATSAVS